MSGWNFGFGTEGLAQFGPRALGILRFWGLVYLEI